MSRVFPLTGNIQTMPYLNIWIYLGKCIYPQSPLSNTTYIKQGHITGYVVENYLLFCHLQESYSVICQLLDVILKYLHEPGFTNIMYGEKDRQKKSRSLNSTFINFALPTMVIKNSKSCIYKSTCKEPTIWKATTEHTSMVLNISKQKVLDNKFHLFLLRSDEWQKSIVKP